METFSKLQAESQILTVLRLKVKQWSLISIQHWVPLISAASPETVGMHRVTRAEILCLWVDPTHSRGKLQQTSTRWWSTRTPRSLLKILRLRTLMKKIGSLSQNSPLREERSRNQNPLQVTLGNYLHFQKNSPPTWISSAQKNSQIRLGPKKVQGSPLREA